MWIRQSQIIGLVFLGVLIITQVWTNLGVIPVVYPFAPTNNLHLCLVTSFTITDCDYWNGKFTQLGSRSTYQLSSNDSNVSCWKDTGCTNYRLRLPPIDTCFTIPVLSNDSCWELTEVFNRSITKIRTDAYLLNSFIIAPSLSAIQILLIVSVYEVIHHLYLRSHLPHPPLPPPVVPMVLMTKNGQIA